MRLSPQFRFPSVFLLFVLLESSSPGADPAGAETEKLFTGFSASSFKKLPAARQPLDRDHWNEDLLSAAVFHETNLRREKHRLAPLAFRAEVRQAAGLQADAMAKWGFVDHVNPKEPKKRTLMDRIRLVELQPAFVAENVAMTFGLRYESGTRIYVREEGGRKIFSLEANGPSLPMHSYVSFAEALVDSWMNSEGHRANILNPQPRFLGAASAPGTSENGMPIFYSVQVFFAPLGSNRAGNVQ
jgi:uncharacterized protein YkwD